MAELQLIDHLRAGAAAPFAWGRCDCFLWVCDLVAARTGVDPAGAVRGRYATAAGAMRLVAPHGDLAGLARDLFGAAGLIETAWPETGDVGLIRDGAARPAFAVRLRDKWAAKTARGIIVEDFPAMRAWRLPCPR